MQYTPQDININGADFSNMAQNVPMFQFKNFNTNKL